MDTGFPSSDAKTDFSKARRGHTLAKLGARLRGEPDDIDVILPFDEVVEALGRRGERRLGLQTIPLDSIVGTVDREREFDRSFRPTSRRLRGRWERIAEASRRGEAMPPIDVFRVVGLHFVEDGHHRVSVARQLGLEVIEARVKEIVTEIGADADVSPRDLPIKSHQRLFFERVPLPTADRERIELNQGSWYAGMAEGVEAWGMRAMQARGAFMTRQEVAREWLHDEFEPIVAMIREAGLGSDLTDAEVYVRVVSLRYLLLRTHNWDEDVLERLREQLRGDRRGDDTLTHMMRGDLKG